MRSDGMRDKKDLKMKYLVIKLEDIEQYMTKKNQRAFWDLFWDMVEEKEEMEK